MGFISDISDKTSKWLRGEKSDKKGLYRTIVELRMFNKRMVRQIRKLEQTADRERERAKKFRMEGDIKASKNHAARYLQIKNQVRGLENFRSNLEGLQFKLEQARNMQDVSGVLKGIASSVTSIKQQLSVPMIRDLMSDLNVDMEEISVTQDVASESLGDLNVEEEVKDSHVDEFLEELDTEIQVETGRELPSAGSGADKVKELEDELDRIKNE
ncbi:MAG: Snf7 family protein [Promethearchaeia archaeon]